MKLKNQERKVMKKDLNTLKENKMESRSSFLRPMQGVSMEYFIATTMFYRDIYLVVEY